MATIASSYSRQGALTIASFSDSLDMGDLAILLPKNGLMPMVVTACAGGRRDFRRGLGVGAVLLAMLLSAVLAGAGLDNHQFWDDEANTAIYGRNLIEKRRLTAWDGTNLVGYSYGGALGEDLGQELRVPPLPAYLAALGMLLFGQDTFGGRVLFVVTGVASIGLLALWMRRHLGRRFPWWLPSMLLALSPAYLLYIRNCRYYALGVMFTLLAWVFWAPGSSRGRESPARLFDRWSLLRYAGGTVSIVLLLLTHYLNAAAVLVTLPLFFLDRRYRQPRQYVLLGAIYAAAIVCGTWILITVNPFAADYSAAGSDLFRPPDYPGWWPHFYTHLGYLLRDLGTHEFLPWCLVAVLLVPWLPIGRRRRLRPLALRGWILLSVVLVYVVLAAALTPADMGKGRFAEMRYVVPLIAPGSVLAALALVVLWSRSRLLAAAGLLLLVMTNVLHLGFLAERQDKTSPWWPPTLYRYVREVRNDYETGNEAMIELLRKLPDGTAVRVWPDHMVYPPMFYVPKLHYCDQLTRRKKIRADLREELRDKEYLFKESSRPDVVLVPAPHVLEVWKRLAWRFEDDAYELVNTLGPHFNYTSKSEIPLHFFRPPPPDWKEYPGMAVLVRSAAEPAVHKALAIDPTDAAALYRLALTFRTAGKLDAATEHLEKAVEIDPNDFAARFELANVLVVKGETEQAIEHFKAALQLNPRHAEAHLYLGSALAALGRADEAERHYRLALKTRPDWPKAHYNLANLLSERGSIGKAVYHFQQALKYDPKYAQAHVNLGSILLRQEKVDEAIDHFQAALEAKPGLVVARINLGNAFRARGDNQAAIRAFRTSLEMVPPESPDAEWLRRTLEELEP